MNITQHSIVAIDYVLTNDRGEELDSSKGKEPLVYLHGVGQLVPGLEAELEGKAKGDAVEAVIPPSKGYGERNEAMVQDVPRDRFPDDMPLEVGMTFQAQSPTGARMVTVVAIEGDQVRIDGNHPLAGTTLNFNVTICDVREATPEELAKIQGDGGSCGSGCECEH